MKRLFLLHLVCLCCSNVMAATRPLVFVSIMPQKYFVEQVGNGLVDVEVMAGLGQNPATYEPTPRQMASIARADIYFSINAPFESAWLHRIQSNNVSMKLVSCCEEIMQAHAVAEFHEHGDIDQHVWTDPNNVIVITRLIAEELSKLDTANASLYWSAATEFINRLHELDSYIQAKTNKLQKRKMIVTHPAWSYFAKKYGFKQISIEQNGKDIQAASLATLIRQAKIERIRAVFAQPQFNNKAAYIIAAELGGSVYDLNPLAYNYIDNMMKVTNLIVAGLSGE